MLTNCDDGDDESNNYASTRKSCAIKEIQEGRLVVGTVNSHQDNEGETWCIRDAVYFTKNLKTKTNKLFA